MIAEQIAVTANKPTPHSHLLILMGRGAHLKAWMQLVLGFPDLAHVELVLGIFDENVDTLGCKDDLNQHVSCVSVAGTTWTTGRNKLIKAALAREHARNKTYSFWTLADADISLHCPNHPSNGPGECLKQYDTFLAGLPANATASTLIANGSWAAVSNATMIHLQAMDAAWNSFRRWTVHVLFPYQPDLDANTWWSSQAIFWYRLQCLSPLYVVTPLYVFYINTEHSDYPRNPRNYTLEHQVGTRIMGRLAGVVQQVPSHYSREFKQEKVRTLVADQPMDSVFYLCSNEFVGSFHSFVLGE